MQFMNRFGIGLETNCRHPIDRAGSIAFHQRTTRSLANRSGLSTIMQRTPLPAIRSNVALKPAAGQLDRRRSPPRLRTPQR
jgi:hypothetical protein